MSLITIKEARVACNKAEERLASYRIVFARVVLRELKVKLPYTMSCNPSESGLFIVRVFNSTTFQDAEDVRRLLHAIDVDDLADVWTYSPEETKRNYPAYYTEQP